MPRLTPVTLLLIAAACGSSPHTGAPDGGAPDGPAVLDAPATPDAAPAAPDAAPLPPGCDYVQQDHTNKEETLPTYTGTTFTLCGTIDLVRNGGTFDSQSSLKQFVFQSTVNQDVVVRLETASPLTGWTNTFVDLFAHDGSLIVGSHGVFVAQLYGANQSEDLDVQGDFPAGTTAAMPYKLTISPMPRATVCPTLTAAPDYTEAHDGADSSGNDVARTSYDAQTSTTTFALTASTTDLPEPTGYTFGATSTHHAHGTSAATPADSAFENDVDTYEITTGPDVDELAVRVDWQSAGGVYVFFSQFRPDLSERESNAMELGGGSQVELWPVAPSTTYEVWVAGSASSGTTGLPLDYDVSLCGGHSPQ